MKYKQTTYKNFSCIPCNNEVKLMKNLKRPIYKKEKISYKKYKINTKRFNISYKENNIYRTALQIGIVKELKNQEIITDDEMLTVIKQIKRKNKIEEEI